MYVDTYCIVIVYACLVQGVYVCMEEASLRHEIEHTLTPYKVKSHSYTNTMCKVQCM